MDDDPPNITISGAFAACKVGNVKELGRIIFQLCNPIEGEDESDKDRQTYDIVEVLERTDDFGNTLLYYASHNGHFKCVKLLLSRGAQDADGRCYLNAAEVCKPLLKPSRLRNQRLKHSSRARRNQRLDAEDEERKLLESARLFMIEDGGRQGTFLKVRPKPILDDEVEEVCQFLTREDTEVRKLDMRKCRMGPANCAKLFAALKDKETVPEKAVEFPFLFCNDIGDEGATAIASFLATSNCLMKLNLCQNEITSEGAKALAHALQTNQSLTALDLNNNSIGDEGCRHLADVICNNQSLSTLSLWNNQITEEGATYFISALKSLPGKSRVLVKLNLKNNSIPDETLAYVRTLLKQNVDFSPYEDAGLKDQLSYVLSSPCEGEFGGVR